MSNSSPHNDENGDAVCRFASGKWQVERTQICADASQRRLTQMIFYFDFICVNLPLSAFICVLYLRNSRPKWRLPRPPGDEVAGL